MLMWSTRVEQKLQHDYNRYMRSRCLPSNAQVAMFSTSVCAWSAFSAAASLSTSLCFFFLCAWCLLELRGNKHISRGCQQVAHSLSTAPQVCSLSILISQGFQHLSTPAQAATHSSNCPVSLTLPWAAVSETHDKSLFLFRSLLSLTHVASSAIRSSCSSSDCLLLLYASLIRHFDLFSELFQHAISHVVHVKTEFLSAI